MYEGEKRTCPVCGSELPKNGNSKKIYCSAYCCKRAYTIKERGKRKREKTKHRRRLEKHLQGLKDKGTNRIELMNLFQSQSYYRDVVQMLECITELGYEVRII